MKELIFEFVNQYAMWGILIAACLAAVLQWRMQRQLKKLNRSLGAVTGKIQDYFSIIMEGEGQEEHSPVTSVGSERFTSASGSERLAPASGSGRFTSASGSGRFAPAPGSGRFTSAADVPSGEERYTYREDRMLTREERELLLSQKARQSSEDEEVFNAVIQEYFS